MSDAPDSATAPPEPERSPRSRSLYVVLLLLAGPCGIHNLYAGRWVRGVAQAALTAPALLVMAKWMREIQPIAETLAGGDPASALDDLTTLAQAGIPDSPLLFGVLAATVWAVLDLFLVKTDGKGRLLR